MDYLQNRYFRLTLEKDRVKLVQRELRACINLDWPGVTLAFGGTRAPLLKPSGAPRFSADRLAQEFDCDGMRVEVAWRLTRHPWLRKQVTIRSRDARPTPDYLEMGRQLLPADDLRMRGYQPTWTACQQKGEEEGAGAAPRCGCPLIGRKFFAGLEHPAGMNEVASSRRGDTISLRHHPVWQGEILESVTAVLGWSDDAQASFRDYLDTIRRPVLRRPLVQFCTFWSDPYIGNLEYQVSLAAYAAWFRSFLEKGLVPDIFTLDAGWQDRQSVFRAKREVGGERGLRKLSRLARRHGAALSLWFSHNGPMGIAPEYLAKHGFQVGGGAGGAYGAGRYGIMMDARLEAALAARFRTLIEKTGVRHFKLDWDNECATNASFRARYPSLEHVREAGVNAFVRLARLRRKSDPGATERLGTWASPWWLPDSTHLCLPDGGDSEFASLPSRTPREAAATHRDLMYHCTLQRDGVPLPLDCLDNHEFPDALRNPFTEDPAAWTNMVWLAFMRGTTYLTFTLMPEKLEDWQSETLREIMRFCRAQARHIYVPRGRMILGNPGRGEIYGFMQPGREMSWCVLRNPRPLPQTVRFDPAETARHPVRCVLQFYPHYEKLHPGRGLRLLAHEVKVVIFSRKALTLPYATPYQGIPDGRGMRCHFPASAAVTPAVLPSVHPIHRLDGLACLKSQRRRDEYQWFLRVPYRLRQCELQFSLRVPTGAAVQPRACFSRYANMHAACPLPVLNLSAGEPGHGERRNPDAQYLPSETFYAVRVPDGGTYHLKLVLPGQPGGVRPGAAWVAGYEAPSRQGIRRAKGPGVFKTCLPVQHPLGFGWALALPFGKSGVP